MVDGDIIVNMREKDYDELAGRGSAKVLGVKQRIVVDGTGNPVIIKPQIRPLNPNSSNFNQARTNATRCFELLYEDSISDVTGLIERQVEYVCMPLLHSGGIPRAAHFNDLMTRFMHATRGKTSRGNNLNAFLRTPVAYNMLNCLTFYIFLHIGKSNRDAFVAVQRQIARSDTLRKQYDMYLVAGTLRLLGEAGPMPKALFRKIVREYLLDKRKVKYLQRDNVTKELADLQKELNKRGFFRRQLNKTPFFGQKFGKAEEVDYNSSNSMKKKLQRTFVSKGIQKLAGLNFGVSTKQNKKVLNIQSGRKNLR